MLESTRLIDTQLEEIPNTLSPPPPYGAPRPSAFRRLLEKILNRLQRILARLTPFIKANPWMALGTVVGLVVVVAMGVWHLHHPGTTAPTRPQPTKVAKRQAAPHRLQPSRVPANPQAAKIAKLQALARDAYKKANYALPVQTSAIAYSKQALALNPSSNSSRILLERSVSGGKYQVRQALKRKDFAQAHRVATAMGQLLPGRKDVAQLQQQVRLAERGAATPRTGKQVAHRKAAPRPKPASKLSFTAYHLHGGKAPADHGPYCLGVLSVSGKHLKFVGRSASPGEKVHKLDFACSDVREIKKNARLGSRQGGFRVRTVSAKLNFVPRDSSLTHVSALASACSN